MGSDTGRTPSDDDRSDVAREPPDSTASEETYATNEEGEPRMTSRSRGGDSGDAGTAGGGTVALLILAGVLLFVFPEPVTSIAGVLLVVAGILLWSGEQFA